MAQIHERGDAAAADGGRGGGGALRECNLDRFLDVVIRADDDEIPGAEDFTLSSLTKVKQAFENIDRDRSGSVSADELGRMCGILKLEMTESELMEVIAEVDEDGDGEINFKEYLDVIQRGMFMNKDMKELFDISAMSEVSTYLLSNDDDGNKIEELANSYDPVDFLEKLVVPMINRVWTAKSGGCLGRYDIAYDDDNNKHHGGKPAEAWGASSTVDIASSAGAGVGGGNNKIAPEPAGVAAAASAPLEMGSEKKGIFGRQQTKSQIHATGTGSLRPIGDAKLLSVRHTRLWCIFNSAMVALVSSLMSAGCDLIAALYFPVDSGQGSNPTNWSLWRFYLVGTLPACVLACAEAGSSNHIRVQG